MLLKTVFTGLLLLMLAAIGWSQRNAPWLQELLGTREARAPSIRFDNGTVREANAASEPASVPSDKPLTLTGVRKCLRGTVVVYTDKTCPPGTQQMAIGGTVNVVDGQRPRPAPDARPQGQSAHAPGGEPTLRDKYMEAVINR